MRKLWCFLAAGAALVASPASAEHVWHTDIPYPSRGACEAAVANLSAGDREWLAQFTDVFSSDGEVMSFLARAFPCEKGGDGQFYISDHRVEVLDSEWFQRRQ